MRHSITSMVAAVAIGTMCAGGAAAQFGGLGSAIKREANKKRDQAAEAAADEIEQAITGKKKPRNSRRGTSSGGGGNVAMGTPAKSLTDFTKCSGIPLEKVTVGRLGSYTFQQGFSKEKRSGFINRRAGNVMRGCITPSLQAGEVVYFEVSTAQYKAQTKGGDWKLQCVSSDDPSGGTIALASSNGTSDSYLSDSHMKLHCGNDQGLSDCASGTNSQRSTAYKNDLRKRGKTGISFMARYLENGREKFGGKLYCQYYNRNSGKSLVGFEMMHAKR